MASCVCVACKAYGGSCACRFDGRSTGLRDGEAATVAKIVDWMRGEARAADGDPDPIVRAYADVLRNRAQRIENGEWR